MKGLDAHSWRAFGGYTLAMYQSGSRLFGEKVFRCYDTVSYGYHQEWYNSYLPCHCHRALRRMSVVLVPL